MKQYYTERHGLIEKPMSLPLYELIDFFIKTYRFFSNKNYFDCAIKGVWQEDAFSNNKIQIIPPSLAPAPEVFFATHLQHTQVWPIYNFAEFYTEEILFAVIEILYDHIAVYDSRKNEIIKEGPRKEFAEHISNILKLYSCGYYIEPTNGFIMSLPNEALKQQLSYKGEEMPSNVFEQLSTATAMFYRFDANMEVKKKAINILADIHEYERIELQKLFNEEYGLSKNKHDKLIFDIINGYNIRHNRANQKTDYSKEIWYDWMMQYYTSVIIAFYKLKEKLESDVDGKQGN